MKKSFIILSILLLGASAAGCSRQAFQPDPPAPRGGSVGENQGSLHSDIVQADNLSPEDLVLSLSGYGAKGALQDNSLSIGDMLAYAVQDEYLAQREYIAIMETFNTTSPYSNIKRSEESHLALLQNVYEVNKMTFPKDESASQLIVPKSLLEAAETGVKVEIDNIAMYDKFLKEDLPENIRTVFEQLRDASQKHLQAFERQVDKLS